MAKKEKSIEEEMREQFEDNEYIRQQTEDMDFEPEGPEEDQESLEKPAEKTEPIKEGGKAAPVDIEEDAIFLDNDTIKEMNGFSLDAMEEEEEEKKKKRVIEEDIDREGELKSAFPVFSADNPAFKDDMSEEDFVDTVLYAVKASPENYTNILNAGGKEVEMIREENDSAIQKIERALDPNKFVDNMKGVNVYIDGKQVNKEEFIQFVAEHKEEFIASARKQFPNIEDKLNRYFETIDKAAQEAIKDGKNVRENIRSATKDMDDKMHESFNKTDKEFLDSRKQSPGKKLFQKNEPYGKDIKDFKPKEKLEGIKLSKDASDLDKNIHNAKVSGAVDEVRSANYLLGTRMPKDSQFYVFFNNKATGEKEHIAEFHKDAGGRVHVYVDSMEDQKDRNGVTDLQRLAERYPGDLRRKVEEKVEQLAQEKEKMVKKETKKGKSYDHSR